MEPRTTLGDILSAALASQQKPTLIEVVLHAPNKPVSNRIIANIKALREATRERTSMTRDVYGHFPGRCMGLTEAKAAIEAIRDRGGVRLHMTPDDYGRFMVNRHDLVDYDWQVKSSRYVTPEPEALPLFRI